MQKEVVSVSKQSGQVGVVVLLVSAVILVVGLSIANRVVKEGQSTLAQEDSARVFSTAESGVQQALNNIFEFESDQNAQLPAEFSFEDANLNQVSIVAEQTFEGFVTENNALEIKINDGQTGTININWSKITCSQGAANLLISHYFLNAGVYDVNYYLVGNCPNNSDQNLIAASAATVASYQFKYAINITSGNNQSAFVRVLPLKKGSEINAAADANLIASAQYTILSSAQLADGSSAKAIEVKRSIPSAPSFMDFALASGGNLAK